MIRIFYGDDRTKALTAAKKLLGQNYEVIDGEELTLNNLPDIFYGVSLFTSSRNLLIKNFFSSSLADKLLDFLDTPHQIIIFEPKLDKRTSLYKALAKKIELTEFQLPPAPINRHLAFNLFDLALKDGPKSLALLETAKQTEDPYRLLGAWVWKAVDQYQKNPSPKNKRVLLELSKLDLNLKTSNFSTQPWLLLSTFLLRLSSL